MKKILFLMFIILGFSQIVRSELLPILEEDKIGWIDENGFVVIRPQFDNQLKKAVLEVNGQQILFYDFPNNVWFSEDYAFVRKNRYFLLIFVYKQDIGYINKNGDFVIEDLRDWSGPFSEGLAPYKITEKYFHSSDKPVYSYMNKKGERAFSRNFELALPFSNGRALVLRNDVYEYIDKVGKTVAISEDFESARSFSGGIAAVRINNKWGFLNLEGELVIEPQFYAVDAFNDGICKVADEQNTWFYIDTTGKKIGKRSFFNATSFDSGLAAVALPGMEKNSTYWKYINENVEFAFDKEFEHAEKFSEGMAAVQINGKYGFIDTKGELVIENKYIYAFPFRNGASVVYDENGKYYINKKGEVIYKFKGELEEYMRYNKLN
jgi:hypothetical protein